MNFFFGSFSSLSYSSPVLLIKTPFPRRYHTIQSHHSIHSALRAVQWWYQYKKSTVWKVWQRQNALDTSAVDREVRETRPRPDVSEHSRSTFWGFKCLACEVSWISNKIIRTANDSMQYSRYKQELQNGLTKRWRAEGPNDGSVRRHTGNDPSAVRRATISLPDNREFT